MSLCISFQLWTCQTISLIKSLLLPLFFLMLCHSVKNSITLIGCLILFYFIIFLVFSISLLLISIVLLLLWTLFVLPTFLIISTTKLLFKIFLLALSIGLFLLFGLILLSLLIFFSILFLHSFDVNFRVIFFYLSNLMNLIKISSPPFIFAYYYTSSFCYFFSCF